MSFPGPDGNTTGGSYAEKALRWSELSGAFEFEGTFRSFSFSLRERKFCFPRSWWMLKRNINISELLEEFFHLVSSNPPHFPESTCNKTIKQSFLSFHRPRLLLLLSLPKRSCENANSVRQSLLPLFAIVVWNFKLYSVGIWASSDGSAQCEQVNLRQGQKSLLQWKRMSKRQWTCNW